MFLQAIRGRGSGLKCRQLGLEWQIVCVLFGIWLLQEVIRDASLRKMCLLLSWLHSRLLVDCRLSLRTVHDCLVVW